MNKLIDYNNEITTISEPVNPVRKSTSFYFVDNCEDSAWKCDYCEEEIKGVDSPSSLGYKYCPFCGLPIDDCKM